MKFTHLLLALSLASLAGCSTTSRPGTYECELHEDAMSSCASVEKAYQASRRINGSEALNSQTVFEAQSKQRAMDSGSTPIVGGRSSGYPDVGEAGAPVYKQPKVLRVWMAPYVDADGNLRSGEYTYFATPGQWNYGNLKKPGAAANAMYGPARTDNLGFQQSNDSPAYPSTPRPAESPKANTNALPGTVTSQQSGTASSTAPVAPAITQPYQRLNSN